MKNNGSLEEDRANILLTCGRPNSMSSASNKSLLQSGFNFSDKESWRNLRWESNLATMGVFEIPIKNLGEVIRFFRWNSHNQAAGDGKTITTRPMKFITHDSLKMKFSRFRESTRVPILPDYICEEKFLLRQSLSYYSSGLTACQRLCGEEK